MGKEDRERVKKTGMVFRDGRLIPKEEVDKQKDKAFKFPYEKKTKEEKPSLADRISKIKKDLES